MTAPNRFRATTRLRLRTLPLSVNFLPGAAVVARWGVHVNKAQEAAYELWAVSGRPWRWEGVALPDGHRVVAAATREDALAALLALHRLALRYRRCAEGAPC